MAAVTLIDQNDLRHLTLRRLGTHLGVERMALYHYIQGREDLLDGIVELVIDDFYGPEVHLAADQWNDYLHRLAHGVRRMAQPHPQVFPLVATRPRHHGCGHRCGACGGWNRSWKPCTGAGSATPAVSARTGRSPASCWDTCCWRCPRRVPTSARSNRPTGRHTAHRPHGVLRLKGLKHELSQDHSADEFDEALETLLERIDLFDHHRHNTDRTDHRQHSRNASTGKNKPPVRA